MKSFRWITVTAFMAYELLGCNSKQRPEFKCEIDSQCGTGEKCQSGVCVTPECSQDLDCPENNPKCNPATWQCVACLPDCSGRICGPDPICGQACGSCEDGQSCQEGACLCLGHASWACQDGNVFWFDSCGNPEELIANCASGCEQGHCINCEPDCAGRQCGPDWRCGVNCGDCQNGQVCKDGACGCASRAQASCHLGDLWWLDSCGNPETLLFDCPFGCDNNACAACQKDCIGRQCGPDPNCGQSCGACANDQHCNADGQCLGDCISDCTGRVCGPDPACGFSCGECVDPENCNQVGQCGPWCELGSTRCSIDGFGFQACGPDPTNPGQNTLGPRIPCQADDTCSAATGTCQRGHCVETEVLFLLDRSSSMFSNGTWNWVKNSLLATLRFREEHNLFGLREFPAGSGCTTSELVPMRKGNASVISASIHDPTSDSATPIKDALLDLLAAYGDANDGQAVILVTDGDQSEMCGTQQEAIDAAARLWRSGIRVYPIAVTHTANKAFLDQLAQAGGSGPSRLVTTEQEMTAAFDQIWRELHSCMCGRGEHYCEQVTLFNCSEDQVFYDSGACASDGNGAAFCDGSSCAIQCASGYHMCPTGCCAWTIETVEAEGSVGSQCSLALDAAQNPHISYSINSSPLGLKVARKQDTSWNKLLVMNGSSGYSISNLVLDSLDGEHVVIFDLYSDYFHHVYWSAANNRWIDDELFSSSYGIGQFLIDQHNDVVKLAYAVTNTTGYGDSRTIKYRSDILLAGEIVEDYCGITSGDHMAFGLDSVGAARLAYNYQGSSNRSIHYASKPDNTWIIDSVDNNGQAGFSGLEMDLDSEDHPHLVYIDNSSFALKYAYLEQSTWVIETISDASDAKYGYLSLVLDSADQPHLAVYDWTRGNLIYATRLESQWSMVLVDSEADVGKYASLALDSAGQPHISYYSVSAGDLKYAH